MTMAQLTSRKCDGKKSRIRETPTLSTDADSRADKNLKGLHDLSKKIIIIIAVKKIWGESNNLSIGFFFTPSPRGPSW